MNEELVCARLWLLFEVPARPTSRRPELAGVDVTYDDGAPATHYANAPVHAVCVSKRHGATRAFARAAAIDAVLRDPHTAWMRAYLPLQ